MLALIRTIGDPAEEFVQTVSGLDDLIGKIRDLLSICREKHHACQAGRNPPCLPKRLVHVKCNSFDYVTLYEPQEQEREDYTALSYCWGDDQDVLTTTETIEQHRKGLPIVTLLKTIRDAVELTRRLDIPYLWIDALCIV
jgi:hypothetical protein